MKYVFVVSALILQYFDFVFKEPLVPGGLNRAPGAPVKVASPVPALSAVQQLLHLAEAKGLRVQFSDYPKDVSQEIPNKQAWLREYYIHMYE